MLLAGQFSFSVKTKWVLRASYLLIWSLLFFPFCPAVSLTEAAFWVRSRCATLWTSNFLKSWAVNIFYRNVCLTPAVFIKFCPVLRPSEAERSDVSFPLKQSRGFLWPGLCAQADQSALTWLHLISQTSFLIKLICHWTFRIGGWVWLILLCS